MAKKKKKISADDFISLFQDANEDIELLHKQEEYDRLKQSTPAKTEKDDQALNAVQTRSNIGSNTVQMRSNVGSNAVQYLTEELPLCGLSRDILEYFVRVCCSETFMTPPITRTELSDKLKVPFETARTAIKKLRKKGHIIKTVGGKGRSGWTRYVLNPKTFFNLTKIDLNTV